jgi:outer membrane protein
MQRFHLQEHSKIQLFCVFGLLTVLATGCRVDEKKEVAKYRSILDKNVPEVTFAPGEPLSLETALLLTNKHNERIAIGGEDYLQTLIDKDRAAANFFPTVSLIPSFSFADNGDDSRNGQSGDDIGDPSDPDDNSGSGGGRNNSIGNANLDVPLNARMNLFNGFRDVANSRRARSEIERQRALMLDMQAVVLLDVARTFYQVLRSEQSVRVLQNSVEVQNERVRDMQARNRIGVARPLDVAQTEAQASVTRASLISAHADVRNGRTVLSYLIGQNIGAGALLDEMTLPDQLPSVDESLIQAETGRQDLAAARATVKSAQQDVRIAIGQYYPTVSLNFNYYFERQSNPDDGVFNGLISTNFPIFTAGIIHANVRDALSRLRQASFAESSARREVEQDVRLAYSNLQAAADRLAELQFSRDAAQEALRQAEGNYKAGRATNLERLVAQDQVLSAELELATATFDRKLFYLNLQRVLGRIADIITIPPQTQPLAATN